jgi:hypothetical protein
MLTFHGDAKLKADLLAEIQRHRKQDQIIQGSYGEGDDAEWKGCAVGCSIHSLNKIRNKTKDVSTHSVYETEFGIPAILAYLEDGIFEGLPQKEAVEFPAAFIQAVPVGVDLSKVVHRFLAWMLDDPEQGVIRFADDAGKISIHAVAELHRQEAISTVTKAAWSAARSAAESAARSAAWSAARSAAQSAAESAAWSAAESAAESAARSAAESAAWSAARSAAESAAWSAAWSAARSAQSNKLLHLLSECTEK